MRAILRHKKGIFFTTIAFLITTVLVLTFGTPRTVTMKDQLPALGAKADAVNAQVKELRESYLPQSLYVAAYSAFYALSEYLQLQGDYYTGIDAELNFNTTLKEMITQGTMCCGIKGPPGWPECKSNLRSHVTNPSKHIGVDECIDRQIMKDKNLTKRLLDMENASLNELRINTSFDKDYGKMEFSFFQDNRTGPWQVGVKLGINYTVSAGDVRLGNAENISVVFDITGLPDPLYGVESQRTPLDGNAKYTNYFNATNLTRWNLSSLYYEAEWRLYKHDSNGSSFLARFLGRNLPSECCGVESIINPYAMTGVNGNVERPYVDWCYYLPPGEPDRCTPEATGALWNVSCITTNIDNTKFYRFALDTYHSVKYNISNSTLLYQLVAPPCPEVPFP